mmetsp:Transcript_98605/g.317930  ORF Transcript_98605/g.317930 Transcript_98605/m.317930 type:complete len:255 (-) Transcript_98605:723-1487(-)
MPVVVQLPTAARSPPPATPLWNLQQRPPTAVAVPGPRAAAVQRVTTPRRRRNRRLRPWSWRRGRRWQGRLSRWRHAAGCPPLHGLVAAQRRSRPRLGSSAAGRRKTPGQGHRLAAPVLPRQGPRRPAAARRGWAPARPEEGVGVQSWALAPAGSPAAAAAERPPTLRWPAARWPCRLPARRPLALRPQMGRPAARRPQWPLAARPRRATPVAHQPLRLPAPGRQVMAQPRQAPHDGRTWPAAWPAAQLAAQPMA